MYLKKRFGENSKRKNTKERNILLSITLIIIISFFYVNSPKIGEDTEARELISHIRSKYKKYVKVEEVRINDIKKTFRCTYKAKFYSLSYDLDIINEIRRDIEKFLDENSDYFLNDGYEISIMFDTNYYEHIIFTNKNLYEDESINSAKLRYVSIYVECKISQLHDYYDMETLDICYVEIDDISILKDFKNLEYISGHYVFKIDTENKIRKMIPNCQIISSTSANFYERHKK